MICRAFLLATLLALPDAATAAEARDRLVVVPAQADDDEEDEDDDDRRGSRKNAQSAFEISYVSFDGFHDGDGKRQSLDEGFGAGAEGVALDAFVFSFGGRYVLAPGFQTGVDVPLVRNTRSGRIETLPGLSDSIYAEGFAIGDITAHARLDVPIEEDPRGSVVGALGIIKAPTGLSEELDEEQLPTGGGDIGLGGELYAVARARSFEAGAAAGMMLLLNQRREDVEVDRGDPRWARVWGAARVVPKVAVGASLLALHREADRVEGEPVDSLTGAGQPGSLAPESRLVSIAPWVEVRFTPQARARLALGGTMLGWLFLPLEAGVPLQGKNVLAADLPLSLAIEAQF